MKEWYNLTPMRLRCILCSLGLGDWYSDKAPMLRKCRWNKQCTRKSGNIKLMWLLFLCNLVWLKDLAYLSIKTKKLRFSVHKQSLLLTAQFEMLPGTSSAFDEHPQICQGFYLGMLPPQQWNNKIKRGACTLMHVCLHKRVDTTCWIFTTVPNEVSTTAEGSTVGFAVTFRWTQIWLRRQMVIREVLTSHHPFYLLGRS